MNYSYTVVADDVDTDGIGIPANAIVVSGQPWRTAGAQFINLNNAALSSQAAHKVIGSTAYISATNPSPLNEETLNGATVTVALDGLTYASGVTDSDFLLATTVQNLSIASVGSVSSGDTAATLTLAFTGDSGFETPGTLAVAMVASAHSGTSALTTGTVPVQPAAPRASISSTSPAALTEANLNTAQVTVALANATFTSGVTTTSFDLVTNIPSVSVASVASVSSGDATATLTLAFTGDFSAVETLAVKVKAAAHTGSTDLTTGTVTVTPTPGIALSRASLALEEDPAAGGATNANVGTYTVALAANPRTAAGGGCLVNIEAASNNADVTIDTDSSPLTKRLSFDQTNWNAPQTVAVTAASDANGVDDAATISHSRTGGVCAGGFFGRPSLPALTVAVNDDEAPTAAIASPSILTAATLNNATVTVSLSLTTFASGVGASSFELVTGAAGVSISSATATAGGTSATLTLSHTGALAADAKLAVKVLAAAHAGDTDLTTGQIDVLVADTAPSFSAATLPTKYFAEGVAIAPFQLPAATGGNGALSYAIAAGNVFGLPAGLKFDASGTDAGGCTAGDFPTGTAASWATAPRTICGTLTRPGSVDSFNILYEAHDADSNRADSDRASLIVGIDLARAEITSTSPATLAEGNLNNATVSVRLFNATFASGVAAASFDLVTAIPGLSVSQVSGVTTGGATATLTLAFAGDFGGTRDLAVKVLAAAHRQAGDLTTGAVPVTASPGVTLSRDSLALNEAPGTNNANRGTYTVALAAVPTGCTGGVGVAVASDNADVAVAPSTLTFTPSSWNTPQTVTVTAAQDDADSNDDVATLSHRIATACAGGGYPASLAIGSVTVTVADDEVGVAIVPTPATLTEANLHGATLALSLTNAAFAAGAPAAGAGAFELVSAIPNLSISQAAGVTAGGAAATLTLAFTGDFRGQPTLAVRLPAASHQGAGALTSNAVTVTANPGVTVSETSLALAEDPGTTNANRGTYTIVPDSPPAGCAGGVGIAVASDNADVAASPAALTFTASNWDTAQTVTVTAAQDDDGADDAATLSHRIATACVGAGYPAALAIGSLSVAVDDDETPAVVVDADPSTANVVDAGPLVLTEGHATDAAKTYSVRLATEPTQTVTVTLASADADAVSIDDTDGDDSNGVQDTLTFTSTTWETAQTVTARAADDADATDESVALAHTASTATASEYTPDGVGVSASLTATVADDDALAAPGNVMVSAQVLALRVQWDAVTGADGYKVQWKSGSEGYDAATREAAATGTSHTLPNLAAGTEYTLRVLPTRTGANDGPASAEATGTPLAVPTLAIDSPGVTEGTGATGGTLRFTVTLSAASGRQVTVAYADAGTGTATSGTDYTALTAGTLTFTAGTTTQTIDVSVTGDAADEPDETVVVTLSAPVNATLTTGAGTGTIIDDDDAPTLSINSPSVAEGAPGTAATLRFTVTLSAASGRQVTVAYADAGTGTATSGTDYTALAPGTLTFAPGTTARTIDVTVIGDAEEEPDETVAVTLSAPVNATLAADAGTGTGTIADDDAADLRVETGGPGTTTRTVNGHTVTVVEEDGVPAGVVVVLPSALGRDLVLRFAPPAAGVPLESARFGLGESAGRRTVVDVTAQPVPSGGLELCLPVAASLRAEAGERGLRLLHYGGAGWAPVARSRDEAADARVCASGVTALSPFAAGYDDLKPTFGEAQVPPQRYREGTEIDPLALPAATGGNAPLAYTLAPALPEGLEYTAPADATSNAATGGTLTGTPEVPAQAAAWTLTATDTDGDTATLTFTVEVEQDLKPTFGEAQVPPQRYVQGLEIDPLALPAATGGDLPLTYALTGPVSDPALPEGLAWSEAAVTRPPRPGTLAGTPTVPAPESAWTLSATDADGDRATLRFTLEVLDRLRVRLEGINAAILPDLSRAMTASTMDAVSGRIGQALSPGGAGPGTMAPADLLTAFAGLLQANEQAVEDGTWSWRQGLDGRRFALALSGAGGEDAGGGTATGLGAGPAPDAGAGVTLWGAGDYRSLSGGGEGSAVDWDGHLFGAHLGMDARFGAGGLAGLALSVSEGRFDYTDTSIYALGETVEGEYESRMTSAHPYVGWTWPAGRQAWASLGYGRGEVTLTDGEAGRQSSESRLLSAAAGGSVRVLSGEGPGVFGPMTVDLKGEAWTTRLEVDDNGERIAGLAVRTHRLRGAVEGARAFALAGGAALTPSVELGIRFDGGDGETGAGVELGGGLDYAHPASSLSADLTGRVLLAHEGATDDWSVGGALRLEPASGRGLSLRLAPSYGDTGSGLARLWEHGVTGSGAGATGTAATGATGTGTSNDESPAARLDTEMGYGLAAFAGVLTPYGGLALSEGGARGYRLGARFRLGPALELGLEGERRESRTERTDHGLMLRGQVRW